MASVSRGLEFAAFPCTRWAGVRSYSKYPLSVPFHGFSPPRLSYVCFCSSRRRDSGKRSQRTLNGFLNFERRRSRCNSSTHSCPEHSLGCPGGRSVLESKLLLLPAWRLVTFGRNLRRGRQRGPGMLVTVNSKEEPSISSRGDREYSGEPKLDATDLLELEFGRLLGEDFQTTMTKVVGKKINPDMSYVDLERQKNPRKQGFRARLRTSSKQDSQGIQDVVGSERQITDRSASALFSHQTRSRRAAESFEGVNTGGNIVPDLISPPIRPKRSPEKNILPLRVVRPVRLGGDKRPHEEDLSEYEGLAQKPVRAQQSEIGLPPELPVRDVIPPMLMRTKVDLERESKRSISDDSLLRRPATLNPSATFSSSPQDATVTSFSTDDVHLGDGVDSLDVSRCKLEEMSAGEGSLQLGVQIPSPGTVGTSLTARSPLSKPVRLNLETKTADLEKPLPLAPSTSEVILNGCKSGATEANEISRPVSSSSMNFIAESAARTSEPPYNLKNLRLNLERKPTTLVKPSLPFAHGSPQRVSQSKPILVAPVADGVAESAAPNSEASKREATRAASLQEQAAAGEGITAEADGRRPILNLERVIPLSKPGMVETLVVGLPETTLENSETSRTATISSGAVLKHSDMYKNQSSKRNLDSQNVESAMCTGQHLEFRCVQDDGTRSQPDIITDLGRNQDVPLARDRSVEHDTVKATWGQDLVSQPQKEKKNVTIRQPSSAPSLLEPASPVGTTHPKPPQLNMSLQSTLQKAIKIHDERMTTIKKEEKEEDWARAEALRDSKSVEEVIIVGNSRSSLLAAFGSLVGYLPSSELAADKRPESFAAWAQKRGIDVSRKAPFQSKQGDQNADFTAKQMGTYTPTGPTSEMGNGVDGLECREATNSWGERELLELYKEERENYLSLLGSEKVKVRVIVTAVDRTLRQLRFSQKQAEGEDQEKAQKKAQLMDRLNVGDVVTCQVKKLTAFGVFVELQGVSALIHVSELSWNRNSDPLSVLQVGEEVEVKVCKLDRFLQRINLSLKQTQPDPLLETLESLVSLEGDASFSPTDVFSEELETEPAVNPELDNILSLLSSSPGISAVVNGRRVHGPALAPGIQIYLSSQLDSGYKLLARFGNEVQEVWVKTSIVREQMKKVIRECMVQDT